MKVVHYHRSSFERQIHESVFIQNIRKHHHLLNSKAEYNRCALPRLGLKWGDKDFKEIEKENIEEEKKEELIREKVREMRKGANKKRFDEEKEKGLAQQPAKKKKQKIMEEKELENQSDIRSFFKSPKEAEKPEVSGVEDGHRNCPTKTLLELTSQPENEKVSGVKDEHQNGPTETRENEERELPCAHSGGNVRWRGLRTPCCVPQKRRQQFRR